MLCILQVYQKEEVLYRAISITMNAFEVNALILTHIAISYTDKEEEINQSFA